MRETATNAAPLASHVIVAHSQSLTVRAVTARLNPVTAVSSQVLASAPDIESHAVIAVSQAV